MAKLPGQIFSRVENPPVLDSRALIFLDQGHIEEALETINKAVSLFSDSEDYSGLTEALFTKCRCLLRLKRVEEAFAIFSELGHIAGVKIGEAALYKYCAMLAEEVRFIEGKTYRERTEYFKRQLIREALREAGGVIGRAAEALGASHQTLSFILKHKFPELYLELGIKRKPRKTKPPKRKNNIFDGVKHVLMPKGIQYTYDFYVKEAPDICTFLLSPELLRKCGLKGHKLVAVAKIKELKACAAVLYEVNDSSCDIGRLIYDSLSNLFVIEKGEGDFVFLSDVSLIGVPIGYCDLRNANRFKLEFKKINI